MLTLQSSPWWDAFYFWWMRFYLRRRFAGVMARGLEHLDTIDRGRGLLVCANHSNWWDGFVARVAAAEIERRAGKDARFLMQEQAMLERYAFFRACGVIGIDKARPREGLKTATGILRCHARSQLWIFPQGELLPAFAPLVIKDGAAYLAKRSGAQLLPVVIRYEWLLKDKPTILIEFGPVLVGENCTSDRLKAALQDILTTSTAELLNHETPGYASIL